MAESDRGTEGLRSSVRKAASRNPATEKLWHETEDYLEAQLQRGLSSLGHRLGEVTNKLTQISSGGKALKSSVTAGTGKLTEGTSAVRSTTKAGVQGIKEIKEKAADVTKAASLRKREPGRGAGGQKSITIVEDVDVGVPVREAYNQWTQYQEFSSFARGVIGVDKEDNVRSNWKVRIGPASRSWKATVTEQVPDERIAWTSEGAKGTTRGVVTFHPLGDHLTKVLLVIDYYPKGLVEKIGNLGRAQTRRVRHDLRRYRAFVMAHGQATGSWRGEIHGSEVVREHEEVTEAEEGAERTRAAEEGAAPAEEEQEGEEAAEGEEQERAEEESPEAEGQESEGQESEGQESEGEEYGDETGEAEGEQEAGEEQYDDWAEYEPDEEEVESPSGAGSRGS